MNALRLTLALPGATAARLREIARWADYWNLAGLWIGDPAGRAPNREDSYVTAAAAAAASVTEDLRIGVLLALSSDQHSVRVAEDVAVVDNASHGRMEVGLVAPPAADEQWLDRAATFLRAWTDWPVPGGGTVAVTPLPVQPKLPRVVAGPLALAQALDAGWMAVSASDTVPETGRRVARRTIAVASPALGDRSLFEWLAADPHTHVKTLRADASAIGAQELALVMAGGAATLTERDIETLGRVVVPALRCVPDEIEAIVEDAWTWLTERVAIHEAPT